MIDTHCHMDDPQYAEELDSFIDTQREGGVEAILVPGVEAATTQDVLDVCAKFPGYLYPALGLHPENVREDWKEQLHTIKTSVDEYLASTCSTLHHTPHEATTLQRSPLIAIGEIGLDYHWDTTFMVQQQEAFREQMRWAEQYHLPVMIHSRDATEDTLKILREFPNVKGVMHCFSGSHEVAEQVVKMGYYLGIGGVLTFKNCKLAEHLVGIPIERLVLETDAPYMAPVPYRGKRNESRWMWYVAERLAQVYNCTPEYVNEVTTANAKALFSVNL